MLLLKIGVTLRSQIGVTLRFKNSVTSRFQMPEEKAASKKEDINLVGGKNGSMCAHTRAPGYGHNTTEAGDTEDDRVAPPTRPFVRPVRPFVGNAS